MIERIKQELRDAKQFHTEQASKMTDPCNAAFERGRVRMANTMLEIIAGLEQEGGDQ